VLKEFIEKIVSTLSSQANNGSNSGEWNSTESLEVELPQNYINNIKTNALREPNALRESNA
jgi:hypothetical protein